ncbi:DUF7310 family coiled-coil domain-containing protein [Halobacterium noricense]|uniref:DUF7310 family coiled-coil domain-containing protein n=1 Tax=Halobacterium noricense TaxID=223182 RepID=UPI001E4A9746|nr:hypothetical protein [Halobacterium noricense]UHH25741.1 hypothetical protein LT974_02125 [Halobacterium noricense]
MSDDDLAERLRAVERVVTDADTAVSDLSDAAAVHDRLDSIEADLAELAERLDALDATVQSLHGYVGDLEAVNERVQRRADAAREAVERLEEQQSQPSRTTRDTAHDERVAADKTGDAARRDRPNSANAPTLDAERSEDADSLLDRVRESL